MKPYLDYGKACAVKELGLPQPAKFEDGQIWYNAKGVAGLVYDQGDGKLGIQLLSSSRLIRFTPTSLNGAVYCPTEGEYFHWVKNFKG